MKLYQLSRGKTVKKKQIISPKGQNFMIEIRMVLEVLNSRLTIKN